MGFVFGVTWLLKRAVMEGKWLLLWLLWLRVFKGRLLVGRKRITSQYLADNLTLFLKTWIHIIAASVVYFFWVCVLLLSVS